MARRRVAQHKTAASGEVHFLALGGLGEIGMNVYLYGLASEVGREWLMVDLGLTFPSDAEPGADVVLPDLRFIKANPESLAGIIITHAHEDHIGAVLDMWPELKAPIYATPFSAEMLKSKSTDYAGGMELPLNVVQVGSRFNVGSFDVELINMAHSIPETSGLAIRTPHGLIVHSSDWKLDETPLAGDPTDTKKLKALGEEGVAALICDSTNAMREGRSPSEKEIAASLADIIAGARKRVAVTTFASNVARVGAIAQAARIAGRELVVAGYALHRVIRCAKETGYLPEHFQYRDQRDFSYVDPDKAVVLVTGSQGEPRAALSRIAAGEHPDIELGDGDMVIFSSRTIPGNEKPVGRVQNNLAMLGCDVITDAEALVHVTGHPRRDELRQMYAWLNPRVAVPMHGEARHLRAHAKLAREAGVETVKTIVDGEIVKLGPGDVKVIDEAPVGRYYRDGRIIVPGGDGPIQERRRLSFVGVVAVAFALDSNGEIAGEIEAEIDGVPALTGDGREMIDVVLDAAEGAIEGIPRRNRRNVETVREAVRRAVRGSVDRVWGKRPVVKVLISQV
ncbi:MAG: hypothetical protein RLZ98_2814 [Pseudomonadota bacterium]|jgi:ribonuclease J